MKKTLKAWSIALFAVIFALAFALVLVPATRENVQDDVALAADAVSYKYYEDGESKTGSQTDYTVVTSSTTGVPSGWYYVPEDVTITGSDFVSNDSATINLIIADGATLTLDTSMIWCRNLYVYGQSEDFSTQGKLAFVNIYNNTNYKRAIMYGVDVIFNCVNLLIEPNSTNPKYENVIKQYDSSSGQISFYKSKVVFATCGAGRMGMSYTIAATGSNINIVDSEYSSSTRSIDWEIGLGTGDILIDNSTVNITSVSGGQRVLFHKGTGTVTVTNGGVLTTSGYQSTFVAQSGSINVVINESRAEFNAPTNSASSAGVSFTPTDVGCFGKNSAGAAWTRIANDAINETSNKEYKFLMFAPALPEITISCENLVYSGEAQTPTVTPDKTTYKGETITFKYKLSSNGTYGDLPTFTGVQSNTTVYFEASADGYISYEGTFSVSVVKADITVNDFVISNDNAPYTGSAITPVVTPDAETVDDSAITFTYSSSMYGEYTTTLPSFTDVGEQTIYYQATADNHNDKSGTFTFTIINATITDVHADDWTGKYKYSSNAVSATYTATVQVNNSKSIRYSLSAEGPFNNQLALSAPGVYTVYFKVVAQNHNDSDVSTFTATLEKGDIPYEEYYVVGAEYTGAPRQLTYPTDFYTRDGSFDVHPKAPDGSDIIQTWSLTENGEYTTEIPETPSANVGEYPMYYKLSTANGYYNVYSNSFVVPIIPKVVTINWCENNFTYDGTDQSASVTATWDDVDSVSHNLVVTMDRVFKVVGNYTATAAFAEEQTNYALPLTVTNTYRMNGGTPTLSAAPEAVEGLKYSGAPQTLISAGETADGTMMYRIKVKGSEEWLTEWSATLPTATDFGTYTVYYKIDGDDGHNDREEEDWHLDVTIDKADPAIGTLPAAIEGLQYNKTAQTLATAGSTPDGKYLYSLDGENWAEELPTGTNAKEGENHYTVYFKIQGDENHSDLENADWHFDVQIAKIEPTLTKAPVPATDLVYNFTSQNLLAELGETDGGTLFYELIGYTMSASTSMPKKEYVGVYQVHYYIDGDENYKGKYGFEDFLVEIKPATPIIEQYPDDVEGLEYTGTAQALISSAGSIEDNRAHFEFSLDGENWSAEFPTATDAGTYRVYYMVKATHDQFKDLTDDSWFFDVEVAKIASSIDTQPTLKDNLVYTGEPQVLVEIPATTEDGVIKYSLDGENWSEELPTATDVGDYTVYFKVEGDKNHNDSSVQSLDVSIGNATLLNVSVEQINAPNWDGTPKTPEVETSATAVNDQPVTFTYSTTEDGTYGEMPSFTEAGVYTVWYTASAPSHTSVKDSFTVKVLAEVPEQDGNMNAKATGVDPGIANPIFYMEEMGTQDRDVLYEIGLVDEGIEIFPFNFECDLPENYDPNYTSILYENDNGELVEANFDIVNGRAVVSGFTRPVVYFRDLRPVVTISVSAEPIAYGDDASYVLSVDDTTLDDATVESILAIATASSDYDTAHAVGTFDIALVYEQGKNQYSIEGYVIELDTTGAQLVVGKASLADTTVEQTEPIVYSGEEQTPQVEATINTKGVEQATIKYSLEEDGEFGEMPSFTEAGTYTVYYTVSADNHSDYVGSFEIVVGKKDVTISVSKVPRISAGDRFPTVSKINSGLIGDDRTDPAFIRAFRENVLPNFEDIDNNVVGIYDFQLYVKEGFELDNYNIVLAHNDLPLIIGEKVVDEELDITIGGLTPVDDGKTYDYEIRVLEPAVDEDGVPYINSHDDAKVVSVYRRDESGNETLYEDNAVVTLPIPDGIDPEHFAFYVVDPDTREIIQINPFDPENPDAGGYVLNEDGSITIEDQFPRILIFNNLKAQIIVRVSAETINDGMTPNFVLSADGYMGGNDNSEINPEWLEEAKSYVNIASSYTEGSTGEFAITLSFKDGKNEYSIQNCRIVLVGGTHIVKPKVIVEGDVQVTIEDEDEAFDLNITLQVEVKTDIKAEGSQDDYSAIEQAHVNADEEITAVYDVKLVRTTVDADGNEHVEEIQPEDIKPGTVLIVRMAIPENIAGKTFRILHIHSADDIEFVEYDVEDGFINVHVDRLSQFAFVTLKDKAANGELLHGGWCIGWIPVIVDIILCLYLIIYLIFARKRLLGIIGLCASALAVVLAVIIICLHLCILSIIGLVGAIILLILFLLLYFKRKKDEDDKEEEPAQTDDEDSAETEDEKENEEESAEETAADSADDDEKVAEEELATEEEPQEEPAPVEDVKHEEPITLKASMSVAKHAVHSTKWGKKPIAAYIAQKHGEEAEINERDNYTSTGLPLADTHYAKDDKTRKCFVYVYETEGAPMLLINADDELAKELNDKHGNVHKSAFPKSKDNWYSLPLDDSYSEQEVHDIIDRCHAHALGRDMQDQELSLKESLALAGKSTGKHSFTKKGICDYLAKYGDDVELNTRDNYTSTGLPLADTHYVKGEDGKSKCFVYVYETQGSMMLLVKANYDFAKNLKANHPNVHKSAFPKSKEPWNSIVLDDTFSDDDVKQLLDDVIALNK